MCNPGRGKDASNSHCFRGSEAHKRRTCALDREGKEILSRRSPSKDAAHTNSIGCMEHTRQQEEMESAQHTRLQREKGKQSFVSESLHSCNQDASHTNSERCHKQSEHTESMEQTRQPASRSCEEGRRDKKNYWQRCQAPPAICRVDDGIPNRLDRLKSLGNAVVPQCAEWIGTQIWRSGLLDS